MQIQDYIFIAAVAAFCIIGMWNIIIFSRKAKNRKLKCKRLREIRLEAIGRLRFKGGLSGHWSTAIMDVRYRSSPVSCFDYVAGDCGTFIQDAIIDRCRLLRDAEKDKEARQLSGYGRERIVNDDGKVELF